MSLSQKTRRWILRVLIFLVIVGGIGVVIAYDKFFRVVEQPPFANEGERFKYGSLGSEEDRGIPYPIFVVLPRIFPDLLPGPGGYRSLGIPWEEGKPLPVGFSLKTMGFPRVTQNCAVCHAATYRTKKDESPTFVTGGPSHTSDVQGFLRFVAAAANDPRFNPDRILAEIAIDFELSWLDALIYRFILIPFTQKALLEQEQQFDWMNRPGWPDWGPGRDDPMNLTKYFMIEMPVDDSIGSADFPSIWKLKNREGHALNWGGETLTPLAVIIDSALGLGAPPGEPFMQRMREIEAYLKELPAPKYPFPINQALAERGASIYAQYCAACHADDGARTGTVIDVAEVGTSAERIDTWTQEAADKTNAVAADMGVERKDMVKTNGYVTGPLDGLWLRAPYLHNGSIPSLVDLLEPPDRRTSAFYRGYDLYDPDRVGFVSSGPDAERSGYYFDTSVRGNGNQGHVYGTDLDPAAKRALIEYLKTL